VNSSLGFRIVREARSSRRSRWVRGPLARRSTS
jgi:hypothetical protein